MHGADDALGIFRIDFDIDGIDIGKAFEQDALAFHHRLTGQRAQVAQAQHGSAIGNHRDEVALAGVIIRGVFILVDLQAGHGDARRITQRQVALRDQRLGRRDGDFARLAHRVIEEGFFIGNFHIFAGHRIVLEIALGLRISGVSTWVVRRPQA